MGINGFRKIMVIINPNAGKGCKAPAFLRKILGFRHGNTGKMSTEEIAGKIKSAFSAYGIVPEIFVSKAPGDAGKEAARYAKRDYEAVLAVGGDGTVNEVINGIAGTDTALGVIPFGTANVFALQNGLPPDIAGACKVAMEGKTVSIDLGLINGEKYFACMAGIGFDAYVIKVADYKMKKFFGPFSYIFATFFSYFSYGFRDMKIKVDGQKKKGSLALVCNGPYYGGGLRIAPADPSDGFLDLCILKNHDIFSFIRYAFAIYKGTLHKNRAVEYFRCKKISVAGKCLHPVHADAECAGTSPVKIKICPGALKTLVPREKPL